MNNRNIKDYLLNNYAQLILDSMHAGSNFTSIAKDIITLDVQLTGFNPEHLRRSVSLAYRQLTDATTSTTTTNDDGYILSGSDLHKNDAFKDYCDDEGIDITKVKSAKYVNHQGQQKFNIVLDFKESESKATYMDVRDEIIADMDAYSPLVYQECVQKDIDNGRLLVIGLADLHLNQLSSETESGEVYSTDIAVERAVDGVKSLLASAKGFGVDTVLLTLGGDVLNTDTPNRTTTSGTHQDTDIMWYDAFRVARRMYVSMIDYILAEGYDVVCMHVVANHDFMSGFMLSDTLRSWYRHSNIYFDVDMTHRKYYSFGKNLIGVTHGDGAKKGSLPLLMANEAESWSDSQYRYIYTQHIHHMTLAVDEIGVTVESLRTPTLASGWAHRNGYQHAKSALSGFVHDKDQGQIAKLTHNY